MAVEYNWIENDAPQKNALITLRRRYLRLPLGLDFTADELAREASDWHLAAIGDGQVVGGLILTRQEEGTVKLRQMIVAPEVEGQGIGRRLLQEAEARASAFGFREIRLHARQSAEAFYQRCGYHPEGELFTEVTLPHRAMVKLLR